MEYVVVGAGPERQALQSLAQELGISSSVEFLGAMEHCDVLRHMSACDVFCLPSHREGFGIVYAEAMALGKPVIGCKGQGVADFVEDGHSGFLIAPHSHEELARVLEWVFDHPREAARIGARGQKVAVEELTWESNGRKVLEIYDAELRNREDRARHDGPSP